MKNKLVALLAIVVAIQSCSVIGQESVLTEEISNEALKIADRTLSSSLTEDLITSLTTEIGNRLAGTEDDRKAREWAKAKMLEMGFDRVWEEPVTIPLWERGSANLEIVGPFQHDMAVVALGNSVSTPPGGIMAEVVQFDEYKDLVAAEPGSLDGKIAYISFRMEKHGEKGYGYAGAARRMGSSAAAKAGASAIVIRSIGSDNNVTPHTGSMNYEEGVRQIPAVAISNPDADQLDRTLAYGQPVTLRLVNSSRTIGDVVTYNVLGEITGTEQPETAIMMGAHLDSWDLGTGALDDGTGVAIVMSAAKHILDHGIRPRKSIQVMLFAAEEEGLYGAHEYVRAHTQDLGDFDNVALGFEWDSGDGRITEIQPGVGRAALNTVRAMGDVLAPFGVTTDAGNDAVGDSDMSALGEAGMPAIGFASENTDYFDYHHTANDTLDKVNMEKITHNAAIFAMLGYMSAMVDVEFTR